MTTKTKERVIFTPNFKSAFAATLNYIASDAAELGCRTKKDYAELVLDADRILTNGGSEGRVAHHELDALIMRHGYDAVWKAASQLVDY